MAKQSSQRPLSSPQNTLSTMCRCCQQFSRAPSEQSALPSVPPREQLCHHPAAVTNSTHQTLSTHLRGNIPHHDPRRNVSSFPTIAHSQTFFMLMEEVAGPRAEHPVQSSPADTQSITPRLLVPNAAQQEDQGIFLACLDSRVSSLQVTLKHHVLSQH